MPSADEFEAPQGQPFQPVLLRTLAAANAGNGIVTPGDFAVTATATDLEIQVAAGTMFYEGETYALGSAATATLSTGDADDRWDTVALDCATSPPTVIVHEGTPSATPLAPDLSGDEMLLAVVYVASGATDVADADILNWRSETAALAQQRVRTVTAAATAGLTDTILADASGGALTVTLPAPSPDVDVTVKKIDATNDVTIATPNAETIDGSSSVTLSTQYAGREIVSDGSNYFVAGSV